jgi:hypothetical protein
MRRLLAWLGGALGGIAAYRFLQRRAEPVAELAPPAPVPAAEPDPRAEALRAKLDETRAAEPADPAETVEPAPVEPEEEGDAAPAAAVEVADPEARRRSVHEHGRRALEEMHGGSDATEDAGS